MLFRSGFLSKAHLETSNQIQTVSFQLETYDAQIKQKQAEVDNAQRSLDSLDTVVEGLDALDANYVRNRQASEREALLETMSTARQDIADLNEEALPLRQQSASIEAEVGPLKYIAEAIYGDEAENYFDTAVRLIILIIVLVFDPLAIVLLMAFQIKLDNNQRVRYNKVTGKLEIPKI